MPSGTYAQRRDTVKRYTVAEYMVSEANPNETLFVWARDTSAVEAIATVARIFGNAEETSEHFDEFTTWPKRIVIDVIEDDGTPGPPPYRFANGRDGFDG